MRTAAYVAVVLVVTAAFVRHGVKQGDGGDYTAERVATIDARGAEQVTVTGGMGKLRIVAAGEGGGVRVRGTAHASRRAVLDDIKLELRREGDVVLVRAVMPAQTRSWFGRPPRRSLDMTVEVPASFDADVTSGRGDTDVRGVRALRITDGSGDLQIADVGGPVSVRDGSGDVALTGIRGDVWIEDGSGDVLARKLDGALVVAADGSGDLAASGVRGDVLVRRDGGGDIDVSDVGGRFMVEHDRGGDVRYRDVRGAVSVPRAKLHR